MSRVFKCFFLLKRLSQMWHQTRRLPSAGFRHPCRNDGLRRALHTGHQNGRQQGIAGIALLCLLLLLADPALAAAIKATPDRNPVHIGETFDLVFSSAESVDADPDFEPLTKDFEILNQSQNSQISMVNGKISKMQEWTLTLSPKRAGALAIPSIAFGSDHSPPASVTVQAAEAPKPSAGNDEPITLEMDAEPKNPYVQAQVICTLRLWMLDGIHVSGNLVDPQVEDALVERLFDGNGRTYMAVRNGKQYAVLERKYALFPQKSGLLRIDPIQQTLGIEVGGRSFFSRSTRAMAVKSAAIDLKVRPQPPEFTGTHWLPAADLKLEESWPQNPPQAKAGEPVTRTLTLHAEGATVSLLPELDTDRNLAPSIKQYPDQPVLNEEKQPTTGISSTRQEKTALIPAQPGEFTLPAVAIPWWNTKTERMETARIPERSLRVEASGEPAPQAATPEPAAPAQAEPAPAQQGAAQPPRPVDEDLWFWLTLLFGLGWLGTGLAWWLNRRRQPPSAPIPAQAVPAAPDGRQAVQALRQACARHDPAATRQALLAWAQTRWPRQRPATLDEVADLGGGALAEAIGRLNRALYGNSKEGWRGDGLWAAVESVGGEEAEKQEESTLAALYR